MGKKERKKERKKGESESKSNFYKREGTREMRKRLIVRGRKRMSDRGRQSMSDKLMRVT